jgi:mono/diheme cytochrome c family protein
MSTRRVLSIVLLAGALAGCPAKKKPGEPQGVGAGLTATATATATAAAAATDAVSGAGSSAVELGGRIYSGNCVPCHQQTGMGISGVYPSLAGSPVVLGDPAQLALWVIKGQRPASMPAGRYSTQMLQFGWMKPADAAALLSYVRSSFGNSAAPVDAAAVAKALGQ